jgi:hypothetical protein
MRRVIVILCGILLIVAIVGILLIWQGGGREKPLADSSVIRIEKVAFGNEEYFALGGRLQKLKEAVEGFWHAHISHMPAPMRAGRSSWHTIPVMHTNQPALYVYISRRVPGEGYRNVDVQEAKLIDEDGCSFMPTQSGGWDDGRITTPGPGGTRYSVGLFRFEAFPRHDKKFHFILYDDPFGVRPPSNQPGSVEFSIANPAPPPHGADWPAEPLPITRAQGKVSFILNDVRIVTNDNHGYWHGKAIEPHFAYTEDGQPSTNWQAVAKELYDASDNFVSGQNNTLICLCPREAAWKLRVRFFSSEQSGAASNAVWTIHDVAVPGEGVSTPINRSNVLQGVLVTAGAFGGSEDYTYSNGIALKAAPSKSKTGNNSSPIAWPRNWTGKRSVAKPTFSLHTKSPHLAVEIGDLGDDQRFTVCAVDDQGREYYGYKLHETRKEHGVQYLSNWYESQGGFLLFDLPADVKTVDLHFCVHTCRTAEFIFKPPPPGASTGK